jgi:hypothetical protein
MQYWRLDGTNFSKNSCIRACATENETWSLDKSQMLLDKSQMLLDKSQMLLAIVLALCSLSALFFALCFLWGLLINVEKKEFNF